MVLNLRDLDGGELRNGFHEVSDEEETQYTDNPFFCFFGSEGYCGVLKSGEYRSECRVEDPIDLLKCKIYNHILDNWDKPEVRDASLDEGHYFQRNESLHDTVIMSAEDVVESTKRSQSTYLSLQDRADDGEDVSGDIEEQGFRMYWGAKTK